jgi:hypothetical protein
MKVLVPGIIPQQANIVAPAKEMRKQIMKIQEAEDKNYETRYLRNN